MNVPPNNIPEIIKEIGDDQRTQAQTPVASAMQATEKVFKTPIRLETHIQTATDGKPAKPTTSQITGSNC